jgi:hypothetical protein
MLRMRTAIVLAAGFAAGYVAGTGRGPELLEKVKTRTDEFLNANGFSDAGERLANAAGEVAHAAGARVQNVSEDVAARVEDAADRIAPEQTGEARA